MATDEVMKVVVAGPFGSGKTTFVTTAATHGMTGSEALVSDGTSRLKPRTTVAMDHSVVTLPMGADAMRVSLYGLPGQERFRFTWPVLSRGLDACIFVLDGSRLQSRAQLKGTARAFAGFATHVPWIVAVNRWDLLENPLDEIAEAVGVSPAQVVACDCRVQDECHAVIQHVVAQARMSLLTSQEER